MSTITQTQTKTHARHIASKVAADLKRVQRVYQVDRPTDSEISDYQKELTLLLYEGYLGSVSYGFKKDQQWVLALKYTATAGGLSDSADPGEIGRKTNISGTYFTSFLSYSSLWAQASVEDQKEFEKLLPFSRVSGTDPGVGINWTGNRNYLSGDLGVNRVMARRI